MSSSASSKGWIDDARDVCVQFQLDLSCMADGEMEETTGARAIAHLEACEACRSFFDDARRQIQAHRELADASGLVARYAQLVGGEVDEEIETIELVHKLSTIFYQLGKAYVLAATDPDWRTRVFERALDVGSTQTEGRGFVDGVLASGKGHYGGIDWKDARHMLNGRLTRIDAPLEKGRRLLCEALGVDPTHEEARLYLAWLDARDGKRIRAAQSYRELFETAIDERNRAHAAIQLGNLYAEEGEYKNAIAFCRWVTMSGLADADERFFFVRFNLGMYYADLGDQKRSLAAFRALLDRHPRRAAEIARMFLQSPRTRAVIDHQQGFGEALLRTCPELFDPELTAESGRESSDSCHED
jgi:tetratricopeptide (TPR) repeat protein